MFVPNFESVGNVTLVLGRENRVENLAYEAVSFKNGSSTAKNILQGHMS